MDRKTEKALEQKARERETHFQENKEGILQLAEAVIACWNGLSVDSAGRIMRTAEKQVAERGLDLNNGMYPLQTYLREFGRGRGPRAD